MITQFEEQSIITAPTTSKTLQFTAENILIAASGNRLVEYNLYNNKVEPILSSRFNIKYFSVHNRALYASVDDQSNILCNGKNIKSKNSQIKSLKYSPDGNMLAVAYKSKLVVYNLEFEKIKTISNKQKILGISWSPDSRFILSWGDDNSVMINNVFSLKQYQDIVLQAHRFKIASAFFLGNQMQYIITIDILGKVCLWKFVTDYVTEQYEKRQQLQKMKNQHHLGIENQSENEYTETELELMSDFEKIVHKGRFILDKKVNIKENLVKHFATIKSVASHQNNMMIVGMQNGVLTIFKLDPTIDSFLTQIQSFQIAQSQIDSLAINQNGNWIALGIKDKGQLIVWEWRSQSYILNQQALIYESTCTSISPDLTTVAVGTLGGIIRLYDHNSKFCLAKFDDQHTAKITAIKYCPQKQGVLVSCSLDGTVRAFDTIRLKCFRVMQPELLNQLHCLDIEPSGELICAGGFDPYEIYVFSLQTGQLVEVISGHQAPVVSLRFIIAQEKVLLISGSWDKTIRVHDLYARGSKEGSGGDSMLHNSEITALAVHDNQLAAATMGGEVVVWDLAETQILFTFDCHRDVQGGRISKETLAAQKNQNLKYFNSIEYSKDGMYLLGGGNSKFVCLYDMKYRILIRRFVISNNLSFDGMKLKINFKTIEQENQYIEQSDDEIQKDNLPGAKTFDVSKRNSKRIPVAVYDIKFTESNREFIVANCSGVSIFGYQKKKEYFDPLDIDETVSIEEIQKQITNGDFTSALILSLKLNQPEILLKVFECISIDLIPSIIPAIPEFLLMRLIETVISSLQNNRAVEICLIWIKQILIDFAPLIKGQSANRKIQNILQEVQKQCRYDFNRIKEPIRKSINILEYLSS